MKKNILVYGLISGTVVSALMLLNMSYANHCSGSAAFEQSLLLGYASMLIAFSMVFVGIRNYRDKYNGGAITFGKAFRVGMLMVLLASTMYVIAWLIDFYCFMPDFMEKYGAFELEKLKENGASQMEIEKQAKEMADMVQMLKNPAINAAMTYLEILPVGLLVSLISSLILKKKPA